MKLVVKYFGAIAEYLEMSEEQWEVDVSGSMQVREVLESRHPRLKEFTYAVSVNRKLNDVLTDSEENVEIAVLPPFAGG